MQNSNTLKRLLEHGLDLSQINNLDVDNFKKQLSTSLMEKHFTVEEGDYIISGDICDDIAVISFAGNILSITPIRQFGFLDITLDVLRFYLSYFEKNNNIKKYSIDNKIEENDEDSEEIWL